jgi:hypothetical protein
MRTLLTQELLLLAGSVLALTTVFLLTGATPNVAIATMLGMVYGAIAYVLGGVARLMWKRLSTRRNRRPPLVVVTNWSRTLRQKATGDRRTASGNGQKPEQNRMRWTEQA